MDTEWVVRIVYATLNESGQPERRTVEQVRDTKLEARRVLNDGLAILRRGGTRVYETRILRRRTPT